MNDRLKTRVWDKKNKTMHYNDFVLTSTGYVAKLNNMYELEEDDDDGEVCQDKLWIDQTDLDFEKDLEVMQCTGLKDATKWDDLTPAEKKKFYSEVCSPDGKSIKYQNIEDVKHLWKGKLIFEGDILKNLPSGMFLLEDEKEKREYIRYWSVEHKIFSGCVGFRAYGKDRRWSKILTPNMIFNCDCEICGNIYENAQPEEEKCTH